MSRLAPGLCLLLVAGCAAPPLEDAPDLGSYRATISTDQGAHELHEVAVVLPADLLSERREVRRIHLERKAEYWGQVVPLRELSRITVGERRHGKLHVVVELRSGQTLRGTVGGNLALCGARKDGLRLAVRLDGSRAVEIQPSP